MGRFRLTFVLLAFAILCSGIAAAQQKDIPKGGVIRGHVKDTTLLESPIRGVRVVFVNADVEEFETLTDADGNYEHANLPAGRYLVSLYKQGYADRVGKPVTVINDGRHYVPMTMNKFENILGRLGNFLGVDRNRKGVLQFSVYSNMKPVVQLEGVEIKITTGGPDPRVVTGISNALGEYQSAGLSPGDYVVTIDKDDYHVVCPMTVYKNRITTAYIQLPDPNKITDADVPPAQKLDELHGKNIIRGVIREMIAFPTPLSDIEVEIRSVDGIAFKGTTNANGEYECIGLPAGRYLINLHKEGYIEKKGIPIIVTNNGNHGLGVTEEGMFVSYSSIADGSLLKLMHGMRKK